MIVTEYNVSAEETKQHNNDRVTDALTRSYKNQKIVVHDIRTNDIRTIM